MSTFDQLGDEQRAIIELVIQRGRSYQSLADVLDIPHARVRTLAREALALLTPLSAQRVDPEWRGQLADYLLGQQSGPESKATRAHLKRSEAARTWAMSLLDSLDSLYANGALPTIPEGDHGPAESDGRGEERGARAGALAEPEHEPERERDLTRRERELRRRDRERSLEGRGRERGRDRELERREREHERELERRERERERRRRRPAEDEVAEAEEQAAALSPAAHRTRRRRRLLRGGATLIVIAGLVVAGLALSGSFSGGSSHKPASATSGQSPQIVGTIPLKAVGGSGGGGIAVIAQRGSQRQLFVQAKVKPVAQGYAYAVWLYNSPQDVSSIGAQVTDAQGNYQGVGPLPSGYTRFKYIDVTYLKITRSTAYGGTSVLRGAFSDLQPGAPQAGAQTTPGTGGGQTPGTGGGQTPGTGGGQTPGAGGSGTP